MKKVFAAIGLAACTLAPYTANAADLPAARYTKAPAYVSPAFSWTGFYLGANVGYGGNETSYDVAGFATLNISSGGFIGGGQIGYNWQAGNFVYGLEVDFQGSGIESNLEEGISGVGSVKFGTKLDYFGTVRGRLGMVAWQRALLYVTGGFAYGHTKTNFALFGGGSGSALNDDRTGWTAGAGFEYMIAPNWSVKTEYLYVDLGRDDLNIAGGSTGLTEEVTAHIFRGGVNYHF